MDNGTQWGFVVHAIISLKISLLPNAVGVKRSGKNETVGSGDRLQKVNPAFA